MPTPKTKAQHTEHTKTLNKMNRAIEQTNKRVMWLTVKPHLLIG